MSTLFSERMGCLQDKINVILEEINRIDVESAIYSEIFNNFDKPFDERLNEAVEFANNNLKQSAERREVFRIFEQTGCIFTKS